MDSHQPGSSPDPLHPAEPGWRALFAGRSPREVLAALLERDPLEIEARCAERLRAQALLLPVRDLHLRAVAHVARHGPSYRGAPPLDVWIAERVRKAVSELVEEQCQRARAGPVPEAPQDPQLMAIAEALGIEPDVVERGCVAFNGAPYDVRSAFCGIVIDQCSPRAWAEENGMTMEQARSALRRALWALGVREDSTLDALLREVEDGG